MMNPPQLVGGPRSPRLRAKRPRPASPEEMRSDESISPRKRERHKVALMGHTLLEQHKAGAMHGMWQPRMVGKSEVLEAVQLTVSGKRREITTNYMIMDVPKEDCLHRMQVLSLSPKTVSEQCNGRVEGTPSRVTVQDATESDPDPGDRGQSSDGTIQSGELDDDSRQSTIFEVLVKQRRAQAQAKPREVERAVVDDYKVYTTSTGETSNANVTARVTKYTVYSFD